MHLLDTVKEKEASFSIGHVLYNKKVRDGFQFDKKYSDVIDNSFLGNIYKKVSFGDTIIHFEVEKMNLAKISNGELHAIVDNVSLPVSSIYPRQFILKNGNKNSLFLITQVKSYRKVPSGFNSLVKKSTQSDLGKSDFTSLIF